MPTLKKNKTITDKIADAAEQAKASDLVQKLLEDHHLREQAANALHSMQESVQHAAEDARETQKKISEKAEKKMAKTEAKAHKQAVKAQKKAAKSSKNASKKAEEVAVAEATAAAEAVTDGIEVKKKKKRHPVRKLLFVATIGVVVALVVSEDARKAALDALFGAEEEFEYTSNVTAPTGSTNGAS